MSDYRLQVIVVDIVCMIKVVPNFNLVMEDEGYGGV